MNDDFNNFNNYDNYGNYDNRDDYNHDIYDLEDAFDISTIQLEPRLQEYIRRKNFNEENDIEPPIPEEQEFCITPHDMKIIKKFKQGKKKLYSSKRLAKDPHFIKPSANNFESIDSQVDFKKDPRYKRLQKKMQSHKDAQKQIRNFEGIDEDYTIFHQSNPYDLKPEKKQQRISKPYDDPNTNTDLGSSDSELDDDQYVNELMMNSRDFVLAPSRDRVSKTSSGPTRGSIKRPVRKNIREEARGQYCYSPNKRSENPNTYHHPAKIAYKQYLTPQRVSGGLEHSRDVNDVIGGLDMYNKHLNSTYEYIQSDADLDTRTFTPGSNTRTQREMHTCYQSVPFMYGNGLPDVSVENSLRGGNRDSSKKSLGFRNPFEHQFDYISEDISDPNHTVQMWPENTRGENKEIARPNSRAVRSENKMRRKDNIGPIRH